MTSLQTHTCKCERCGYVAQNIPRLINHLRNETSCPSTYSNLAHGDLIERLVKLDKLTCEYCHRVLGSRSGKVTHVKHCKLNLQNTRTHVVIPSQKQAKESKTIQKKSIERNVTKCTSSKDQHLVPFGNEIELKEIGFSVEHILGYATQLEQGIISFFADLHTKDMYRNIKWKHDKPVGDVLVIYDGERWIEMTDKIMCQHLGMLYGIIEEIWCDYEMDVRCGKCQPLFDEQTLAKVNNFLYDVVVDDESVMFCCQDLLFEYLQEIKAK